VRECARIQTFPDDFKFGFSKTVNVSQIGNAVPPILGHIVAREIAKYLRKVKGMGDRE
jgi:DNA (cytosine-5)-methyltransferase 1